MLDAEALDDQALLAPASQAVRCSVCHSACHQHHDHHQC